MNEYHIRVPFTASDCCHIWESEVTLAVFAKSEEQARGRAKEYADAFPCVSQVHSTEVDV